MTHMQAAQVIRTYLNEVPEDVRELGEAVADHLETEPCNLSLQAMTVSAWAYYDAASRYGDFDRANRVTASAAIRAAGLDM